MKKGQQVIISVIARQLFIQVDICTLSEGVGTL